VPLDVLVETHTSVGPSSASSRDTLSVVSIFLISFLLALSYQLNKLSLFCCDFGLIVQYEVNEPDTKNSHKNQKQKLRAFPDSGHPEKMDGVGFDRETRTHGAPEVT
jgi:hypothetical protein